MAARRHLRETESLNPTGSTVCFSHSVRGQAPNSHALYLVFCSAGAQSSTRPSASTLGRVGSIRDRTVVARGGDGDRGAPPEATAVACAPYRSSPAQSVCTARGSGRTGRAPSQEPCGCAATGQQAASLPERGGNHDKHAWVSGGDGTGWRWGGVRQPTRSGPPFHALFARAVTWYTLSPGSAWHASWACGHLWAHNQGSLSSPRHTTGRRSP